MIVAMPENRFSIPPAPPETESGAKPYGPSDHSRTQGADGMQEPASERMVDLYWLAFLFTGHSESSVEIAIESLDSQDEANPFFSTWMSAWSRRVVIAKALSSIRKDLVDSANRTKSAHTGKSAFPPRDWTLNPAPTKAQLEAALLTIDVFPRCALVLSFFEKASLEDTAVLLNADRSLVGKAQLIGLQELNRNLARMQGWTTIAEKPHTAAGAKF
jgi:DNA-directed RNA polymerase specialized sigma24 family protein